MLPRQEAWAALSEAFQVKFYATFFSISRMITNVIKYTQVLDFCRFTSTHNNIIIDVEMRREN